MKFFGIPPLRSPSKSPRLFTIRKYSNHVSLSLLIILIINFCFQNSKSKTSSDDAKYLNSDLLPILLRACFWAVFTRWYLLTSVISFLRVEGFLKSHVRGSQWQLTLGRSVFRGTYVHYPLIILSFVIAFFVRGLGFTWLALLVVVAEFQIVISRFVYSYEQAFMGDLVRMWYAALFLFASSYALIN